MSKDSLPRMRVKRKPWNLARIGSKFIDALSETEEQREPWADFWDEHNARALKAEGPLWVALGDSMAQGIGATAPENGFLHRVIDRLSERTGEPWRVVNLAMTGARIEHVVDDELPLMSQRQLDPIVSTCMIGFNDFIGGTSAGKIESGARRLVRDLPNGTLVGRVSTRRFTKRATVLRDVFREADKTGKITLFDPWQWPDASDIWARDRIHLNDAGYQYLGDAVFESMVEHGVTH
jgi:lysophospholipase L1-like esterase